MSYELPRRQQGRLPSSMPPRCVPPGFQNQLSYDENAYEQVQYYESDYLKPKSVPTPLLPISGPNGEVLWQQPSTFIPEDRDSVARRQNGKNRGVLKREVHRRCWSLLYSFLFLIVGFSVFLLVLSNIGYFEASDLDDSPTSTTTTPHPTPSTTPFTTIKPNPSYNYNSTIPTGNCLLGYTKFHKTGYCYKKIYHGTDFFGAQKACESEDANLVSIHSEEENIFVADLHRKDEKTYTNHNVLGLNQEIWIGLKRESGEWEWTDGSPVDYAKWAPDEPNRMDTEPHVVMTTSKLVGYSPEGRHWNNVVNSVKHRGLICKKAPERK